MLRTFIFIVGVAAGAWILYKMYDAVMAVMRANARASSPFTAPFVILTSRAVWRKSIGLAADMTLSSVIYMFYGLTAGGQLGAGMASTLALLVSVGIYAVLEANAQPTHEKAQASG